MIRAFAYDGEDNFLRFTVSSMSLSSMTYEAELHIQTPPLF